MYRYIIFIFDVSGVVQKFLLIGWIISKLDAHFLVPLQSSVAGFRCNKAAPPAIRPGNFASVWCPQPVADSGFRQDVLGPLGIDLHLLPELAHIDPQILRVCQIVP